MIQCIFAVMGINVGKKTCQENIFLLINSVSGLCYKMSNKLVYSSNSVLVEHLNTFASRVSTKDQINYTQNL